MTDERGRGDANHCFVCGPTNPIGLQILYRMDGEVCRASFVTRPNYVGYDNMTHGGIIFSALDDVMANWFFLQGVKAFTAKCEIRYRQPVELNTEVLLEGRLVKRKSRVAVMESRAIRASDQHIVADAQGSFMIVDGDGRIGM